MKIRNGFVSNSSSSSFIVIGEAKPEKAAQSKDYVVGQSGTYEFGWSHVVYDGVDSMINFAWLQAEYSAKKHPEYMEMLVRVIKQYTGAKEVTSHITKDYDDKTKVNAYIDHQSSAAEGENLEMFESEEILAR
jgi:hypothetical protein